MKSKILSVELPITREASMPLSLTDGRLIGLAWRSARLEPMQVMEAGTITQAAGLVGDFKGLKFRKRQITVLAIEDWRAACEAVGAPDLPWTSRRANLLVEGLALPRARGSILGLGAVRLEVTGQTYPCVRMEQVHKGLLRALASDWRGGLTCTVLAGGPVRLGDPVTVLEARQWELPLPLPG
jgi:MOSC domain-containing protein YiiM